MWGSAGQKGESLMSVAAMVTGSPSAGALSLKDEACLLASNAFSAMIHILSHAYQVCALPQSVQGLCCPR